MTAESPDPIRMDGQCALVTGAASGIGRATIEKLSARGATVVGVDIDDLGLRQSTQSLGIRTIHADVTDDASIDEAITQVLTDYGHLDAVVACAGRGGGGGLTSTTQEWDALVRANLRSVFQLLRASSGPLRDSRGSFVAVASELALVGRAGALAYSAAKAGVLSLVRSAALEAAPHFRVNAVAPGATRTPMLEADLRRGAESLEEISRTVPLARPAFPHEIAAVIAFLLSAEASYVTGAAIVADGGFTAA